MSSISILDCHRRELESLLRDKARGVKEVRHILKFIKENDPREDETKMIPIDEAIESWAGPIKDMEAGADQEQYNY